MYSVKDREDDREKAMTVDREREGKSHASCLSPHWTASAYIPLFIHLFVPFHSISLPLLTHRPPTRTQRKMFSIGKARSPTCRFARSLATLHHAPPSGKRYVMVICDHMAGREVVTRSLAQQVYSHLLGMHSHVLTTCAMAEQP